LTMVSMIPLSRISVESLLASVKDMLIFPPSQHSGR
jgi:hypothetical protein